jgi:hypothetical protein
LYTLSLELFFFFIYRIDTTVRRWFEEVWQRMQVGRELLRSEATYLAQLEAAERAFAQPLRELAAAGSGLITGPEVQMIFGRLESVIAASRGLLAALEARAVRWHLDTCIGEVFVERFDMLEPYVAYMREFEVMQSTLRRLLEAPRGGELAVLLRALASAGQLEHRRPHEYLIQPVQRPPRYVLFLERLLRYTPEDHADRRWTEKALSLAVQLTQYIEEKKRVQGEWAQLIASGVRVAEATTDSRERRLIRTGLLLDLDGARGQERLAYLFEDCLVLGTQKQKAHREKEKEKDRKLLQRSLQQSRPASFRTKRVILLTPDAQVAREPPSSPSAPPAFSILLRMRHATPRPLHSQASSTAVASSSRASPAPVPASSAPAVTASTALRRTPSDLGIFRSLTDTPPSLPPGSARPMPGTSPPLRSSSSGNLSRGGFSSPAAARPPRPPRPSPRVGSGEPGVASMSSVAVEQLSEASVPVAAAAAAGAVVFAFSRKEVFACRSEQELQEWIAALEFVLTRLREEARLRAAGQESLSHRPSFLQARPPSRGTPLPVPSGRVTPPSAARPHKPLPQTTTTTTSSSSSSSRVPL